ncbi:MAG: hypothetical protein WD492_07760 [Alkalispirochaeta sp.]
MRDAIYASLDRDTAATSWRVTLEQHMSKIVGAFQSYAEALFDSIRDDATPVPQRNVFQNLDRSSDFWEKKIGLRYETMLTSRDWRDLKICFQQRHLLAHREGIVDDEYLQKSGDTQYQVGQRIVVTQDTVLRFANLVDSLAAKLREACQGVERGGGL